MPERVALAPEVTPDLQRAVAEDVAAGRPLFAIVHVTGKQYKVGANDVIVTGRLECPVGTNVRLEKVRGV